mgnify:FL=1
MKRFLSLVLAMLIAITMLIIPASAENYATAVVKGGWLRLRAEASASSETISAYFTGTTGDTLRGMCDTIRDKAVKPAVAVLVGKAEDKITMAVTVNKLAQEKGLKAGVLVKEISAIAGGKGGGKPDFAMAGLKDETKIDEALAAVKGIVEKQLG